MREVNTKTKMEYVGDKHDTDTLICAWFVGEVEVFRMRYRDMFAIAHVYSAPGIIQEAIFEWAKMLRNPD